MADADGDLESVRMRLEHESAKRSPEDAAILSNLVFQAGDPLREDRFQQMFKAAYIQQVMAAWDSPSTLNRLAWEIANRKSVEDVFDTVSDEALRAAKRACALTYHANSKYLDTVAVIHAKRGEAAEAVLWQEAAVKLLTDDAQMPAYLERLEGYRSADALGAESD